MCILALAMGIAGCGNDSDGDEADTVVPATATAPASATSTSGDPEPLPIAPGNITSATFQPHVRLTVGEGWVRPADTASEFVIEHDVEDAGQQAWIGFFRVSEVRNEDNFTIREPVPASIISWLQEHKDIIVREPPVSVTIGGQPATQLEVRVDGSYEVPLFDEVVTNYDDRFIVTEIDVSGERVILAAGAFDWRRFDEVKPLIDEVLATVEFE
jgi:hypothetical protein